MQPNQSVLSNVWLFSDGIEEEMMLLLRALPFAFFMLIADDVMVANW
jgi:hypothetical protein